MKIGNDITPDNPVEDTIIHHTIENIEYQERTVEKGIFTTKSEDRDYIDIIYTDGESGEKKTVSFQKEHIHIGDDTELITKTHNRYLYLTKKEYIDYFYPVDEEQPHPEDDKQP